MKKIKLNLLEKKEMNEVRGGEAMNPCSYHDVWGNLTREQFLRLYAKWTNNLPWERRSETWDWPIYK